MCFSLSHTCLSIFFNNVSGDLQILNHLWSQCIRCDLPVAKSHHQNGFLFLQMKKFFQMVRKYLRNPPVIILIRHDQIRGFHGNIRTFRLFHRFRSLLRLNPHHRCIQVQSLLIFLLNRHTLNLHIVLLILLLTLHCKIRSYPKIPGHRCHLSFLNTFSCLRSFLLLDFPFPFDLSLKIITVRSVHNNWFKIHSKMPFFRKNH